MSDSTSIEIKGLAQFRNGLQDLPAKIAKKVLLKSIKTAALLLLDEVQRQVPINHGALRSSITVKTKSVTPWEVAVRVQSMDTGGNKRAAWTAPLVEYGSTYIIKKGKRVVATGRVAPRPFFRNSFDAQQQNMQQIIADEIGKAASKEWSKLNAGS